MRDWSDHTRDQGVITPVTGVSKTRGRGRGRGRGLFFFFFFFGFFFFYFKHHRPFVGQIRIKANIKKLSL